MSKINSGVGNLHNIMSSDTSDRTTWNTAIINVAPETHNTGRRVNLINMLSGRGNMQNAMSDEIMI